MLSPLGGDETITVDELIKTHRNNQDGLWKKLDILGVVSETAIWQYIWYGELSFQTYNDVDRAFYDSITVEISFFCVISTITVHCRVYLTLFKENRVYGYHLPI